MSTQFRKAKGYHPSFFSPEYMMNQRIAEKIYRRANAR